MKKKSSSTNTRSVNDDLLLVIPPLSRSCSNTFFERSINFAAPTKWNGLNKWIRRISNRNIFKSTIKPTLFLNYFDVYHVLRNCIYCNKQSVQKLVKNRHKARAGKKEEYKESMDKLFSHRIQPETRSVEEDPAYILCIIQAAFYMNPMNIIMSYNTI